MLKKILLLGAGFSRNWGAPLATEVFESLLGLPEIAADAELRNILWNHKDGGGFENALAQVQQDYLHNNSSSVYKARLDAMQSAIDRIFSDIDKSFEHIASWDFNNIGGRQIFETFLKFDAIFTLNQDLMFERFYNSTNVMLRSRQRWYGWGMPGVKRSIFDMPPHNPGKSRWEPLPESEHHFDDGMQPYFKLHGSWRWFDSSGQRLMVMGGSKALAIGQHALLKWYQREFERYLNGASHLMIIGYGFRDTHINNLIDAAVHRGNLKLYLVDPAGEDVANPDRGLKLMRENPYKHYIDGVMKRPLSEVFGKDSFAHSQLNRFLDS